MGAWDQALQDRIGPPWDAVAGTDGADTDINALVAAGHKRILIAEGAILTANLVLTSANSALYSPRNPRSINLGAFRIQVDAAFCHLEGFGVNGGAGVGIEVVTNGNYCTIHRCQASGFGSHGIQISNSFNDHQIVGCYCSGNTGSGINIGASASTVLVWGNFSWNNTGWGINDLSNSIIEGLNRLDGNTAGARNTSSTTIDGKSKVS